MIYHIIARFNSTVEFILLLNLKFFKLCCIIKSLHSKFYIKRTNKKDRCSPVPAEIFSFLVCNLPRWQINVYNDANCFFLQRFSLQFLKLGWDYFLSLLSAVFPCYDANDKWFIQSSHHFDLTDNRFSGICTFIISCSRIAIRFITVLIAPDK